ncbi:STAS domain-containing protein [Streptomyces sp. NBC_00249]|uniref:STAS domain-containing protein n=1 Tax=Streptomyces sp. NBC_00249 TaxID=2975690 RepID=UPI002256F4F9|nr:STAS domain-containing protein [Streptomyces sp. NBC_00249]MCX5195184.1 STAS domain-containing protein [Streptomyces sp. NBC_00249]
MNTPIDAINAPAPSTPDHVTHPPAAPRTGALGLLDPTDPSDPPDPLPRVRSVLRGGVLTVGLDGEFDHWTCAPLYGLLDAAAARGARHLVLDAALVTFCDSALVHVLDRWARAGGTWEAATTSRPVRLLLDLARRLRPPLAGGKRVGT